MNTQTNEVFAPEWIEKLIDDAKIPVETAEEALAHLGAQELPEELEHAAKAKLAGRDRATVSRTSGGRLSRFAADQRRAQHRVQRR